MNISIGNNEKFYSEFKKIGFYGVDFMFANPDMHDFILTDEYTDSINKKYQLLKSEGLQVCQTHLTFWPGHFPPIGDGTYKAYEDFMLPLLIKEIELTAKLQCPTAVIHLYFEDDREKSRQGNIELITKLLPVLEKNNVILSMENVFGPDYCDIHLSTAEDLLYYTDYFKSPYLGICLDTGHAVIRGQKPVEMLKAYGDKLTALHIHTTVPSIDMHALPYCVSYGEQIDWEAFYDTLVGIGYKGTFNLEVNKSAKLNDKATLAFYRLAYEISNGIIKKEIR